jgi:hypothetical protein
MLLSSQNSYVEALIPSALALEMELLGDDWIMRAESS